MPDSHPLASRRTNLVRLGVVLIVIPLGVLLLLGVVGAIDGLLQADCQRGFYSACGPKDRALAYVVFIGTLVLGLYYVVVAVVGVFLGGGHLARSMRNVVRRPRR